MAHLFSGSLPTLTPLEEIPEPILNPFPQPQFVPIPQPQFIMPNPLPHTPINLLQQSLNNSFRPPTWPTLQAATQAAASHHTGPNLTDALQEFAQTVRESGGSGNGSKVHKPDPFDGSDLCKLRAFLMQCKLNFNSKPHSFQTNKAKVNYALSYLKGTALDWFEPELMSDKTPDWLNDFTKFSNELRNNFGPHDLERDMEDKLESLWMKDNQQMVKYLVDFNRLTARVTWGKSALWHQLYKGLPNQIKDEVSWISKPTKLADLQQLVQTINAHYWEQQSEFFGKNKKSDNKSSSNKSKSSSSTPNTSNTNNPSISKSSNNKSGSSASGKKSNSGSSDNSRQKSKPDLSSKLRKDSKLMPKEHACHFANNLYMFCGGVGHKASECLKASSSTSKAKACVANTKEDSSAKMDEAKN